jgi:hypothetical protein
VFLERAFDMLNSDGLGRGSEGGADRRGLLGAAATLAVLLAAPSAIAQVDKPAPASGVLAIPAPAPAISPAAEVDPNAPSAAPADASRPAAQPIDRLGEARWSDGVGFVQAAPEKQDATKDQSGTGGFTVPKIGGIGLDRVEFRTGIGSMSLNPTNDEGRTADGTAVTVLEIPAQLRLDFRTAGSLLAPWLDAGLGLHFGSKTESVAGTTTDRVMSVSGLRLRGRLGLDLQPLPMLGAGAFGGYGRDFFDASLESTGATSTESDLESDGGLLYGLHARFRTLETPQEPARFYADAAFTFRNGEHTSARYLELESGVRLGSVYFLGWFEKRVSASGSFTFGGSSTDATTLSQAIALSMPIEQRLGLGISVIL